MSDAQDEATAPTVVSPGADTPASGEVDEGDRPTGESSFTLHSPSGRAIDLTQDLEVTKGDARYAEGTVLGAGGMGEVQLRRDRHVGRDVAVKVLHQGHRGSDETRARFLREARVQGQLEHPAIVPVYDIGRTDDGVDYFSMRRIRGETLADVIEALAAGDEDARARHTRHTLLATFVRVCLAVDYAHTRGVVHRDLKPANVMLGRFGEVYLLDWGIAKLDAAAPKDTPSAVELDAIEAPIELATQATAAGAVLGTPGYMPPEQVLASESVDARADVYALGTILFELLALEPLVKDDTAHARILTTLKGVDARPSARRRDADLPPELDAICAMATAREPKHRYGSARLLANAVEQYLSGDRDLAMRRDLAAAHLADARAHMRGGSAGESRTRALRELGRALALAPEDEEARGLLVSLLTAPPEETPDEVVRERRAVEISRLRRALPAAAAAYVGVWIILLPAALFLGVRRPWMLATPLVGWAITALVAVITSRDAKLLRAKTPWTTILALVAAGATSLLFGPFVVAPIVICANAMGNMLTGDAMSRRAAPWLAAAALCVPIALSWMGLHPVTTVFDGTEMHLTGAPLALPEHGTYFLLTVSHVALLFGVIFFAGRFRDLLDAADLKSRVNAWQLAQLAPRGLPKEASARPPRP